MSTSDDPFPIRVSVQRLGALSHARVNPITGNIELIGNVPEIQRIVGAESAPGEIQFGLEEDVSSGAILSGLDLIYIERAVDRTIALPGLLDLLEMNEPDHVEFARRIESAPIFFSRQILDMARQSPALADIIVGKQIGGADSIRFRRSVFEPLYLWFRGFSESKSEDAELSIPVFEIKIPKENVNIDIGQSKQWGKDISFKVDLPGLGGGGGKRHKISLGVEYQELSETLQGHVRAAARIRTFIKGDETIRAMEIIDVFDTVYIVLESDSQFVNFPEAKTRVCQAIMGVSGDKSKAGRPGGTITIEEGHWAQFSMSLGGVIAVPRAPHVSIPVALEWHWQSESLTKFEVGFKFPGGALFRIFGPNKSSLRLCAEEEKKET